MDKYLLEDGTGYYEIEGGTDDYLIDRYVVLNSPADAAAITDTTPTLEFTGTDPQAHDIRYNVRLGTAGFLLKHVDAYLYKAGSPTDHLWIEVRESIGGDIIATSPFVAASSLVASPGSAIRFTLDSAVGLFAGMKYYIVMQRTNLRDTTNAAVWKRQDTDTFAGGDAYSMANGTWGAAQTTADYRFILYDAALTAIISQDLDGGFGQGVYGSRGTNEMQGQSFTVAGTVSVQDKISGTDAGFLNTVNGADTDPFTSGQMASYTVQSALANGTYYWRTRGIDPAGGNVYSDWTETRSFVLTAGGGTPYSQPVADTLTLSDSTSNRSVKATTDSVTLSDSTAKTTGKKASDSVTLADSVAGHTTLAKSDNVSLTDATSKYMVKGVADSLTLADNTGNRTTLAKSDSVTLSDSASPLLGTGSNDFTRSVDDNLSLSDVVSKVIAQRISNSLSITDATVVAGTVPFVESLSLSDALSNQISYRRTFTESVSLFDSINLPQDSNIVFDHAYGKTFYIINRHVKIRL